MKHTNQSPRAQERDELEREVEALRREVRQLRLEQDLLNKANRAPDGFGAANLAPNSPLTDDLGQNGV